MKTIRLLYPDYVSGGLDAYYFGAELMAHILPENPDQPLVRVEIAPPDGTELPVTEGIYGRKAVMDGIRDAQKKIGAAAPDKIITIGGNCLVSLAPFDYLHEKYGETGILWIDAHPDVSTPADGYPNAHAMVLGSLLGYGDAALSGLMRGPKFRPDQVLYVGLQGLHDYQKAFLDGLQVPYTVQTERFIPDGEIRAFARRWKRLLVHFDIDVLDERLFHGTYFANPELVGDGSGGGKMTVETLSAVLQSIQDSGEILGFTVAEYLPFEEYRLRTMFSRLKILTDR